ncbi:aromatic-ring-hydroxylating dioxygenase subunit beta [Polyangium fumosum]|uniref:Ring-hydroxylating dioxygenase subunit beta n=1 Tax=Polyangium fumosum TaxID=889272 RepID=A0A4U1IXR0_9BACT|nr:aromatic-ring-hydroxylating dioxygenase subunit beta [Polyangium fumosum]TKC99406.1 ring-hydroxylating dioxygenase subunit beta [Polyangium fumosum]
MNPETLRGYALRAAVEDVLYDYAAALDEGALERWPFFFTAGALYEVVSRENEERGLPLALVRCEGRGMMIDRATALKEVLFYSPRTYRHFISNVRPVWRSEERIEAVSNFVLLQTLVERETTVLVAGQYRDTLVVEDGKLLFGGKRCIYDTTMIPNTVVYPL